MEEETTEEVALAKPSETLKVEVEVGKETYELGTGIVNFIKDVKGALADGYQAGEDLNVILASGLTNLVTAVDGLDRIGAESVDRARFIKTMGIMVGDLYDVLSKKTKD